MSPKLACLLPQDETLQAVGACMCEHGEAHGSIGTTVLTPDHGTVLWTLCSRGDEVTAVVRLYPRARQLMFLWNGREYYSQMFQNADTLLAAAREKQEELEADGWKGESGGAPAKTS